MADLNGFDETLKANLESAKSWPSSKFLEIITMDGGEVPSASPTYDEYVTHVLQSTIIDATEWQMSAIREGERASL